MEIDADEKRLLMCREEATSMAVGDAIMAMLPDSLADGEATPKTYHHSHKTDSNAKVLRTIISAL